MTSVLHARSRRLVAAIAALLLTGSLAACGEGGKKSQDARSGVLTLSTGSTGNFVRNFNPFSPNALQATQGMIYEPLFLFNAAKYGNVESWLGEDFEWSHGGRTVSILIRNNVTWNDGEPFTSEDVAFTFQTLKDNPELNQFALPIDKVSTDGKNTAVITFSKPAYTKEYFLLGKQKMLPKHIWSKIPDKEKKTTLNANPVGTGAWTVKEVQGMTMELSARDDYYVEGLPNFKTLRYVSYSGNNASSAAITSGKTDWASSFIPDVNKNYLAKDPEFDLVNIPLAVTFLWPNAQRGPTADVNVRKAISAALDRDFMSKSVYDGNAPVTNPMALLLPNFEEVLDPKLKNTKFETGEEEVSERLTEAGYVQDGDHWTKDGKKLSITLNLVSGYTDYVSVAEMAKQQLADVGITLDIKSVSYAQFTSKRSTGEFELLLDNAGNTPDPRAYYDQLLNSAIAPEIGETTTVGNYGRYENDKVDKALDKIGASNETEKQLPSYYVIQREFIKDMPLIPLFAGQNEQEFNGNNVSGYPTKDNLYAAPSVWFDPDAGWVAARLKPVTGD